MWKEGKWILKTRTLINKSSPISISSLSPPTVLLYIRLLPEMPVTVPLQESPCSGLTIVCYVEPDLDL